MIYIANKKYTCSICAKEIPVGHRFWKKSKLTGKQHLNCCDYETPIADARAELDLQNQLSNLRERLF